MFSRLVVATDLTSQSAGAFQLAARMAAPDAHVLAVHVIHMPPVLARWKGAKLGTDIVNYRRLLQRQIAGAEQELRRQLAGLDLDETLFEPAIRVGDPPTHITAAADRHGAEVILVGRGAGGRLGPIAEAVVRLVGRAVMVAPVPRGARKQQALPSSVRRRGRLAA